MNDMTNGFHMPPKATIKNLRFGTKVNQLNHKDLTIDICVTNHINHLSCQ